MKPNTVTIFEAEFNGLSYLIIRQEKVSRSGDDNFACCIDGHVSSTHRYCGAAQKALKRLMLEGINIITDNIHGGLFGDREDVGL